MSEIHEHAEPMGAIARRVRERETARLLRYNDARRSLILRSLAVRNYVAEHIPTLAREFLETLFGSMIGFAIIAGLLAYVAGVRGIYTFVVFGLVYSLQSTYYKHKLTVDPGFTIPSCRCAGNRLEGTEIVLRSRQSAVLGIPNSVVAVAFYSTLLVLTGTGNGRAALPLAVIALAASVYLSYVMLVKIRSLCAICINIAALNALILWQLLG